MPDGGKPDKSGKPLYTENYEMENWWQELIEPKLVQGSSTKSF